MEKKIYLLCICILVASAALLLKIYYFQPIAAVPIVEYSQVTSHSTLDKGTVANARTSVIITADSHAITPDVPGDQALVKKNPETIILEKILHQLDITDSDIVSLEINETFIELLEPGDSFVIDLPGGSQEKITVIENGSMSGFNMLRGHVFGYPEETMFYLAFDESGSGSGYLNSLRDIYSYRTMYNEFFVASNIKSGSDPRQ